MFKEESVFDFFSLKQASPSMIVLMTQNGKCHFASSWLHDHDPR